MYYERSMMYELVCAYSFEDDRCKATLSLSLIRVRSIENVYINT